MQIHTLRTIREAGAIKRYHTARTIACETVAEHSFNVVNLILVLTEGQASRELILAALTHDMGELAVGDIPSPIKRAMPEEVHSEIERREQQAVLAMHPQVFMELSAEEEHILSLADKLDGLLKCTEELKMGNRHIITIGERYCGYVQSLTEHNPLFRHEAEQIIHAFRAEYLK